MPDLLRVRGGRNMLQGYGRYIHMQNSPALGACAIRVTANNFAVSIVALGCFQLGQTPPTTAPEGGSLWMDIGTFSYSAMTGIMSGMPLSPQALAAFLVALLSASPAMGAGTNFNGFQNNAAAATQVDDGK